MKTLVSSALLLALASPPSIAGARQSGGLANAFLGFLCYTESGEDSGLYAIDVGPITRTGVRFAKLISFGDGLTKEAGEAELTTSWSFSEAIVFASESEGVYVKVSDVPGVDGSYEGVAHAASVSGLEYAVSCKEKSLFD